MLAKYASLLVRCCYVSAMDSKIGVDRKFILEFLSTKFRECQFSDYRVLHVNVRTGRQRGRDIDYNKCSTGVRTHLELFHTSSRLQFRPWHAVAQLFDILLYNPEGRDFDRDFSLTYPSSRTMALGSVNL
jgi:hypothetical protein